MRFVAGPSSSCDSLVEQPASPNLALIRRCFLLSPQSLLVAFQGLAEAFQLVEYAAFIEIGESQRIIKRNRFVVALNRVFQLLQLFQRGPLFNESFGIRWIQSDYLVKAFDG